MVTKKITPDNMKQLAFDIMDYLNTHDMWESCIIYVSNQRFLSKGWGSQYDTYEKGITKKGTEYIIENDINVKDYLEYSNPDTISLAFEGLLYDVINADLDYISKLDHKFLDKFGLYFELGHAWNMSAY